MLVRIGHSADPDDAFMVWALASGSVDARGFEFELVPEDIQVLNEWALEGRLEALASRCREAPRPEFEVTAWDALRSETLRFLETLEKPREKRAELEDAF